MNEQLVLKVLNKFGAVLKGHFIGTQELHLDTYINKDAIYPHTEETSYLCRAIAAEWYYNDDYVEVVIAPEKGGIILSQWVTHHLNQGYIGRPEVLGVYAEKSEDRNTFIIKRGYDKIVTGRNVLVVEDVLNTGDSAKKVIEAVRAVSGNIVGLGVIWNRGGLTAQDIDVPKLTALVNIKLDAWNRATCPLCAQGVPINTDVGKGR